MEELTLQARREGAGETWRCARREGTDLGEGRGEAISPGSFRPNAPRRPRRQFPIQALIPLPIPAAHRPKSAQCAPQTGASRDGHAHQAPDRADLNHRPHTTSCWAAAVRRPSGPTRYRGDIQKKFHKIAVELEPDRCSSRQLDRAVEPLSSHTSMPYVPP